MKMRPQVPNTGRSNKALVSAEKNRTNSACVFMACRQKLKPYMNYGFMGSPPISFTQAQPVHCSPEADAPGLHPRCTAAPWALGHRPEHTWRTHEREKYWQEVIPMLWQMSASWVPPHLFNKGPGCNTHVLLHNVHWSADSKRMPK